MNKLTINSPVIKPMYKVNNRTNVKTVDIVKETEHSIWGIFKYPHWPKPKLMMERKVSDNVHWFEDEVVANAYARHGRISEIESLRYKLKSKEDSLHRLDTRLRLLPGSSIVTPDSDTDYGSRKEVSITMLTEPDLRDYLNKQRI